MEEYIKVIAGLQDWLLHLLYKDNEIIYVALDENNHPLIKKYEKENIRYVTIYPNEGTLKLIKGISKVKSYKFKELLDELKSEQDIRFEILDSNIYEIRNAFKR